MDVFARLKTFRQAVYENLCRAHDATFELTDAVMLTRQAYCLAYLSQCPIFRRKWSSIYEALQDTRPQRQKLMKLYIKQTVYFNTSAEEISRRIPNFTYVEPDD